MVAGRHGHIKIIDCNTREVIKVLVGHGSSINELRVHPLDHNLLASASKDTSCRLWNIKTEVCIAVFAGENGHRDDVLSCVC
jgi:polycomb protein EED